MAPAIKLAREGFILNRGDTDILDTTIAKFRDDPEAARIFLRKDGEPFQPGDRLIQTDLANTLEAIAQNGPDAFYHGKIPQAVETAAKKAAAFSQPKTLLIIALQKQHRLPAPIVDMNLFPRHRRAQGV